MIILIAHFVLFVCLGVFTSCYWMYKALNTGNWYYICFSIIVTFCTIMNASHFSDMFANHFQQSATIKEFK